MGDRPKSTRTSSLTNSTSLQEKFVKNLSVQLTYETSTPYQCSGAYNIVICQPAINEMQKHIAEHYPERGGFLFGFTSNKTAYITDFVYDNGV